MARENAHLKEKKTYNKPKKVVVEGKKSSFNHKKAVREVGKVTGEVAKNIANSSIEASKTDGGAKITLYVVSMTVFTILSMLNITDQGYYIEDVHHAYPLWLDFIIGNLSAFLFYAFVVSLLPKKKEPKKTTEKKSGVTQTEKDELLFLRMMAQRGN